ncbi:MAG TPA: MBOAT family O-acyltransferase, partial [Phenylobacterium sp.]
LAEALFDKPGAPTAAGAWLGTLAYTLQIYFDFAGYSTMAIGLAVIFGFSLPRNFRTPYASASITEFWRRWHISLSSWFRDYLYIPLGGNRGGALATYRNLIVVFLLCGLWHGASWTFVLWGAWHGLFLVLERAGLGRLLGRAWRPLAWAYALVVVMLGWVLFRAPDLERAVEVWRAMFGFQGLADLGPAMSLAVQPLHLWLIPLAAVLALAPRLPKLPRLAPAARVWGDNLAVGLLLVVSVLRVAMGTYSPFLYFRF